MTVIVNGIDTNLFKPVAESRERSIIAKSYGLPSDCFVVGSVGRLEAEKNYSMLVRAFARMTSIEGARQSHLVFIGQGSDHWPPDTAAGVTTPIVWWGHLPLDAPTSWK